MLVRMKKQYPSSESHTLPPLLTDMSQNKFIKFVCHFDDGAPTSPNERSDFRVDVHFPTSFQNGLLKRSALLSGSTRATTAGVTIGAMTEFLASSISTTYNLLVMSGWLHTSWPPIRGGLQSLQEASHFPKHSEQPTPSFTLSIHIIGQDEML